MKKSDFIHFLEKKLTDQWGYDMDLTRQQLSTILKIIENLGMLPPPTKWEGVTHNIVYAYYDFNKLNSEDAVPSWEPE